MKPIIIRSNKFLDLVSLSFKAVGISIFPFIILRKSGTFNKNEKVLIAHETTHFWQTVELGIVGFYVLYLAFFLYYFIKTKFDTKKAYMFIPFEREAYTNEKNLIYNESRKYYSWIKFIK